MSQHHKSTKRMLDIKAAFREQCEADDTPCWLCGLKIDYSIPPEEAWKDDAFQYDHYYVVSKYPELAEDPGNGRASHARCNRERGDGAPRPPLGVLSEVFF